ncbi:MAG: hypothetical protein JW894_07190 [Bacteroidales bacterium]|nr:hypothetical protein [Bacteroidales bacterium]
MILPDLKSLPATSPEIIIRLRDSIYAADLLFTAVCRLNFFTIIAKKPGTFKDICSTFKIHPRTVDVMLTLFKSYGLIEVKEDKFYATQLTLDHLTDSSAWCLIPYLSTHTARPIIDQMHEVLRSGEPGHWGGKEDGQDWATAMEQEDFANNFTRGMDSRGAVFAPSLTKVFDFSGYKSFIDIGGASGIYAAVVKSYHPDMKVAVLEKPPVDQVARRSLKNRGLDKKIEVFGADMFKNELPKGYDIHFYSHVLHDWNSDQNRKIISNSFRNLNHGGIIMIHDAHLNPEKTGPVSVAEYSVLIMFSTHGKCYSLSEIKQLLTGCGFVDVSYKETVGNRSIITGKKI